MSSGVPVTLEAVHEDARERVKNGPVLNLVLHAELPIAAIERPFDGLYEGHAQKWQAPTRPALLHMNHGEYIHAHGNGIQHIVEELKRKPDSNRALYSLVGMDTLINSGDQPIPSFMMLQFTRVNDTLHCTAYFRALEVVRFLPVNLTEMCQIMRTVRRALPGLSRVDLCVHAFRAYGNPEFDLLERAEIDRLPPGEVAVAVVNGQTDLLRQWLTHKAAESTVVLTAGLIEVISGVKGAREAGSTKYSGPFEGSIREALEALEELKQLRTHSSHATEIAELTLRFRSALNRASAELA